MLEMFLVRQILPENRLDALTAARQELARVGFRGLLRPGQRVGITAGSRGLANLVEMLRLLCAEVRGAGAEPVVLAAMGSHGGGTEAGQMSMLESLGVTPEAVAAQVLPCAAAREVARLPGGGTVMVLETALACDALVVLNRVKPHTSFHGPVESGLLKMLAVGLGGPAGARSVHQAGAEGLAGSVLETGRAVLQALPVAMGLAVVEDAREETMLVRAALPGQMETVDRELLPLARENMARLPLDDLDLLVVEEMGKIFSGTGMDTNVIGRLGITGRPDPPAPRIRQLAVLDLAGASHGNANGLGLADFTTRRLAEAVDWPSTYLNSLTAGFPRRAMLPVVAENDRQALELALDALPAGRRQNPLVARVRSTLHLERLELSAPALAAAEDKVTVLKGPRRWEYDAQGRLIRLEAL